MKNKMLSAAVLMSVFSSFSAFASVEYNCQGILLGKSEGSHYSAFPAHVEVRSSQLGRISVVIENSLHPGAVTSVEGICPTNTETCSLSGRVQSSDSPRGVLVNGTVTFSRDTVELEGRNVKPMHLELIARGRKLLMGSVSCVNRPVPLR